MKNRAALQIFTEIGYGNRHVLSTEIEKGDREKRVRGLVRLHITGIYLRVWIGYRVYVLSTQDGFKITHKPTRRFKCLLGLSGRPYTR